MTDAASAYRAQERAETLRCALGLPIADAVCRIVFYNDWRRTFGPPPYCEPIPLDALNSKGTAAELNEWTERARHMMRDGDHVADAFRRETDQAGRDAILAAFRGRHPGLERETYDEALVRGLFWSIW